MIYAPWQIKMGMSLNPGYWSMRAMRHMFEYGTTDEQIAKVFESPSFHKKALPAYHATEESVDRLSARPPDAPASPITRA